MRGSELSLSEARRIALTAQGLDRPRPSRVDARHVRRAVRQLGLLQIDYVNVLCPAHYQVLFSRLGPYERSLLDNLVYRRHEFTEQWAHEASIVPVETWPLLRHRMETRDRRSRGLAAVMEQRADYVNWVLGEIRTRGPLTADDLPEPEGMPRRNAGAWFGTLPRAVLEAHFGQGTLAVTARRPDFVRVYDLTERVIPREHHRRRVGRDEAQRELLQAAARSHGVATAADLADYYRMPIRETRARLAELVETGELREVRVERWRGPAYLQQDARLPRRIEGLALLSPFDPVVWYRERAARLFDFDYRIEIYIPPTKRTWGYYVLPFLMGDRLVARVDLKADRARSVLLVQASYIEPQAAVSAVALALGGELRLLARWLGLGGIAVAPKGNLASALSRAAQADVLVAGR